jgi:gamma-glutamyltranspeptidase/glutathione hydrolase
MLPKTCAMAFLAAAVWAQVGSEAVGADAPRPRSSQPLDRNLIGDGQLNTQAPRSPAGGAADLGMSNETGRSKTLRSPYDRTSPPNGLGSRRPGGPARPKPVGKPTQPTQPAKPQTKPTPQTRKWLVSAEHGIVASDSPEASKIGAEVLKMGGNAIDAAVATSFALGVTRPYSTGLGGGGFALVYLSRTRETIAIDFRETAPGDATWDMFVNARKKDPAAAAPSREGGLAVGVPGQLAGAAYLLEQFGTMRLDDLVNPAAALAERGFKPDADYIRTCKTVIDQFRGSPELIAKYGALLRTYLNNGQVPSKDELIRQPELASALRLISSNGPEPFYEGRIAEAIVRSVERAGGILTLEDLFGYRVRERKPVRFTYRGYEIASMPPPSSGGIVIAEVLNILSAYGNPAIRSDEPGLADHVYVEALKHAFADRSRWLGDPAYVNVPVGMLTSRKYADTMAKAIDEERTQPPKGYGSTRMRDDAGTSHFCVVDYDDNVVSWTETINTPFGSYVVAEPFGIVLNNEMDDFSAEPDKPDAFGLRTSSRNAVAPGKRPLSSMSPTIVFDRNGLPILTLGASGGPRIITSVLSVLRGVLDYNLTLGEAMEAIRIHHQWMPNEVRFNEQPDAALKAALSKRGHRISNQRTSGVVQAVEWENDNTLLGASDPKKGGRPAGY